jgi:ABC-type transport system involved in cytochrome bd biosynthesis fused ATPase/permease subunit
MDEVVTRMGDGLDAKIDEGGHNLSSGQRQLLGLARALIRSSRVMVWPSSLFSDSNSHIQFQSGIYRKLSIVFEPDAKVFF